MNAHEGKDLQVIDYAVGDRSEYQLANDLWNLIEMRGGAPAPRS